MRVFLSLAVLTALALADPTPARGDAKKLVDSYLRTDFDGIARAGQQLSAQGLAPLLRSKDAAELRAAIAAAPYAEDSWQLLLDLAAVGARPDRRFGPGAVRAAVRIAQELDPARIAELEIGPSLIRERALAFARLAAAGGAWPDVRVHALEAASLLRAMLSAEHREGLDLDLEALARDAEPEVRRAAMELTPVPLNDEHRAVVARVLEGDGDPTVAIVAGQVLCGGLAVGDAAPPILSAAGPRGLERLRNLITNPSLPIVPRIDAAYCLLASATGEDKAALARLAKGAPKHARAAIRKLMAERTP